MLPRDFGPTASAPRGKGPRTKRKARQLRGRQPEHVIGRPRRVVEVTAPILLNGSLAAHDHEG